MVERRVLEAPVSVTAPADVARVRPRFPRGAERSLRQIAKLLCDVALLLRRR